MANIFKNITGSTIVSDSFNQKSEPSNKKIEITKKVISKTSEQPISKDKPKVDNWERAKTVATILAFLTAAIGVITKILDIW